MSTLSPRLLLTVLCTCVSALFFTDVAAQCPTSGNLTINSNADALDFRTMFGGCTDLPGNLTIAGTAIDNLSDLSQLESVGGDLTIDNLSMATINGLSRIESIGGDFAIRDLPTLSRNGFNSGLSLTQVGGKFILSNLPNLTEVPPLSVVTSLTDGVEISGTNISDLSPLAGIMGTLDELTLDNNTSLTDISALGNVTSIGDLTITNNTALSNCDITPVCMALDAGNPAVISGNGANCTSVMMVSDICNGLPVSWLSFTAERNGKQVDLDWATSAEVNNASFRVERSEAGNRWAEIGMVMPNTDGDYAFTDPNPFTGTALYRLRQVDYDGTSSLSEVRFVAEDVATATAVWPNPFTDQLTVQSDAPDVITIYDVSGRAVRRMQHAGGGAQVQRLNLKQGVYLLRYERTGRTVKVIAR